MADNDIQDTTNNGNEWDVVSLTASTYAASPSYGVHDLNNYSSVMPIFGRETPRTMFLSDHFVFPPSQHENLPLEPDIVDHAEVEAFEEVNEEGSISGECDERHIGLDALDERDEQNSYGEKLVEEKAFRSEVVEFSEQATSSKMAKDEKLQPEIPSGTWWKRHAVSLYSNAKESNSFWSIFIAAAVAGFVIIGQRWQQEKWHILQMKLHLSIHDEKMARLLGPLTRLKDAVIGSQHRISFLRNNASFNH